MNNAGFVLPLLPLADWAALIWYFAVWIGYAIFAKRRSAKQPSLLEAGQHIRTRWMIEATYRDQRVFDAVVIQNLTSSPSFFASTTILIIGGLLAVLGTTEQTTAVVSELPFAARTTALVFDLKVLLLASTFVYAFFRFTWSLRQYNFGVQVVASAPAPERFAEQGDEARAQFARRGAGIVGLAAEAFNDGMRAYYMAFSGVAWFFSPIAFAISSTVVVVVLYQREFRSQALALLRDG
jgi:uncharacterized membrane protein